MEPGTRITTILILSLVVAACGGATRIPEPQELSITEADVAEWTDDEVDERTVELEAELEKIDAYRESVEAELAVLMPTMWVLDVWNEQWEQPTAKEISDAEGLLLGIDELDVDSPSSVVEVNGGEDHVEIVLRSAGGVFTDRLEPPMRAMNFPSGTFARMGRTRSLDGTLTAESIGGEYMASWTYHPDSGFQLLIERSVG